ncbi:hypothetical protein EYF80_067882 [Liparis tanakae]|uniref:Uncharacterized protein n=1 Tax=Liparis tanakae TaxID=230148 RepID=A0A4Z2DZQ7_9TELE|nr:hypothetical protein EYF80_067882 [Liparis tanakae]
MQRRREQAVKRLAAKVRLLRCSPSARKRSHSVTGE